MSLKFLKFLVVIPKVKRWSRPWKESKKQFRSVQVNLITIMIKPNYLFLTTLLVIGIIFTSGCVQQFLTYDNPTYGIRIKYPSDWTKSEQVGGSVVVFLAPKENLSDVFQENVNVLVQDLSTRPMTLSEYTNLSIDQISQNIFDANIIDSSATTLDGNPAHKVVYTGTAVKVAIYVGGIQGEYRLKWMQIWTIKDNKVYIISYAARVDKFSEFSDTTNQMISSFEVI